MPPGKNYKPLAVKALFALALFFALTINLESTPPLWWDEGWNLSVARNWVELGHYGRLLTGEPTSPGMSTGFPAVVPIALSFRILGVGVWQGRLVGVLFALGAIALIYQLASRLYDSSVAIVTLAVLLFMSGHGELHPVMMGRQALGEIPAIFYLLGGYVCFLWALRKSVWLIGPAMVLWGVALLTKLQVWPFWTVSLLTPLFAALFRKSWKLAGVLTMGVLGSLITSLLLLRLLQLFIHSQTLPLSVMTGLYNVTAWVPFVPPLRLLSLIVILVFGFPTLLGLCYAASKLIRNGNKALENPEDVLLLSLFALTTSWFAWYLFLSVGWFRYLFPATFIGSIFAAAFLHHVTNGFDLSSTIKRGGYALRHLRFNRESVGALLATLLVVWTSYFTILELYRFFVVDADKSAQLVADFINNHTPSNTLIETYDSELFFLLNRRYHYPPDQIHVELNRRTFLGQDVSIDYDPLAANPDYLVVGPHSRLWRLYDPILETGAFRLLRSYRRYDVYQRVR